MLTIYIEQDLISDLRSAAEEGTTKEMGVDYENEDPVVCDPASPKFMDAYLDRKSVV